MQLKKGVYYAVYINSSQLSQDIKISCAYDVGLLIIMQIERTLIIVRLNVGLNKREELRKKWGRPYVYTHCSYPGLQAVGAWIDGAFSIIRVL